MSKYNNNDINKEVLAKMKQKFIELLKAVNREGMDKLLEF